MKYFQKKNYPLYSNYIKYFQKKALTLTPNLNPSALTASRLLPNFPASAKLLFRLSR